MLRCKRAQISTDACIVTLTSIYTHKQASAYLWCHVANQWWLIQNSAVLPPRTMLGFVAACQSHTQCFSLCYWVRCRRSKEQLTVRALEAPPVMQKMTSRRVYPISCALFPGETYTRIESCLFTSSALRALPVFFGHSTTQQVARRNRVFHQIGQYSNLIHQIGQ